MKLTFKSIHLENFKGLRDNTFDFDEGVNSFYGANETGKSTIADAISWVLFGKDSHDNQNFGIKTYDKNREPIPHLKHSVTIVISVDGEDRTLKRELIEKWSKDGNKLVGNTTAYTVDGVDYTSTDYKAFINSIVDEVTFKSVTNPTYFLNLPWQDQRKILSDLVGELKNEEITKGDVKFSELLGLLQKQELEDILKHLHFQLKQVEEKLDLIPVRLKEQNKALPEKLNWDKIYIDLENAKKKQKSIDDNITSIKRGNGEEVARKALKEHIDWLQKQVDEKINASRTQANSIQDTHDVQVRNAKKAWEDAEDTFKSIGQKINDLNTFIQKTKDSQQELENKKMEIQKEWNDNKAKKTPDIPDDISVCPTCGQPLPAEQLKDKVLTLQEHFNKHRAEEAKVIKAKFSDVKAEIQKANDDLENYQKEWTKAQDDYSTYKKIVEEKKKAYANISLEAIVTYNDLLSKDEEYKKLEKSITSSKEKYDNAGGLEIDQEQLDKLNKQYTEQSNIVDSLTSQLVSKAQYDKISDNIKDINDEKKSLDEQWNSLNEKLDVAEEYQTLHDNLLESKVNAYFSYVKFRLFKRLVNGTKEPYCECYRIKDGVPYYDLNSAGKLNAGIDIINTFQREVNIFAPVVIDNAEATNKILNTNCQQIRLYVSTDKKLIKRVAGGQKDLFA